MSNETRRFPSEGGFDIYSLPNVNAEAPYIDELKTKGYCIVPNIVSQDRLGRYIDDAYSWLEGFDLGFDRNDKSTWTEDRLPVGVKNGLYNKYSVTHEDWVWRARCEPGMIEAFSTLWGTDELVVSFDGVNITFPCGPHGRTDVQPCEPWPHTDQNPHRPDFMLAQGILTFSECGPDDGGLVVLEGSHHLHNQYHDERGGVNEEARSGRLNSYRYEKEEAEWYRAHGAKEVKICCPAGSLIIWDSRLIHWNQTPTGKTTRIVAYICYQPRSAGTKEELEEKVKIFERRQGTTHWPLANDVPLDIVGVPLRNGIPDPYHRMMPKNEPEINDTVLQLAGVKAYQRVLAGSKA